MSITLTPSAHRSGDVHDDAGSGEPALLFVPGWCGDRSVFDELTTRLAHHRRTVAVDLPEHGHRLRTGTDFGTAEVVDEIVALTADLGIDRFVPVALSHAGWTAIELRRRLGAARVPAMVLLDWMVLGAPPEFLGALAGLQRPESWQQVRSGLFSMWTSDLDIPALHTYVEAMGCYDAPYWQRAAREISTSFVIESSPVGALEALEEPCPTLHLYAQPADPGYLAAQQAYAATHPWFRVHRLDARSHFPMFEVPEELSDVIETFLGPL